MKRREFISAALALGAAGLAPRSGRASDGTVEVLLDEPIGTIAPELQGHFTEHIGEVVYNGIWVGEDSKIPNVGGIRKALIEHMRQMRAPIIRWPGGCLADSYNWRDGVGPRSQRPVRTNFWDNSEELRKAPDGPQKYEPNTFGTAEFMRFCQLCGAKPYVTANVRSLSPLDFDQWAEYCNAPAGSATLAKLREQDGSRDPYNIQYWGIGNENWGCGGNMLPQEYAAEFRKFTAWVPNYGEKLHYVACGPGAEDYDAQISWTRGFFEALTGKSTHLFDRVFGFAMHYYAGGNDKDDSIHYSADQWYRTLTLADLIESLIGQHWQVMGEYDKQRKAKLVIDEWGAWHAGPSLGPEYFFSYIPALRDALVVAINLDIFNRNADKLAICNIAQLINNICTLFLTKEEQFVTTPVFHVFDMYKSHQGAQSVRAVCNAPDIFNNGGKTFWGLNGSASVKGKSLVLTMVNPHVTDECAVEISLRGAEAKSAQATVLTSSDIQAHNDFEHPDVVVPVSQAGTVSGRTFRWTFKPASVTKLAIELV
jgi:alpha-N-arabinofuranosidase